MGFERLELELTKADQGLFLTEDLVRVLCALNGLNLGFL